jgi:hypothetical protein
VATDEVASLSLDASFLATANSCIVIAAMEQPVHPSLTHPNGQFQNGQFQGP